MSVRSPFGELITAMVTPFTDSLELNMAQLERFVLDQFKNEVDSIVVCGTTGESPTLSEQEKLMLFSAVVKLAREHSSEFLVPCRVLANVGGNCTATSVEFAKKAQDCGVDGLMAVVPYYNKPPQEGMYQHFKAIADAVELPLMLYNIPGRSVVKLENETILRLAHDCKNIIAIKQATDDLEETKALLDAVPEGFYLYSGNDDQTLSLLEMGAAGVVSTTSNVAPKLMADMCHCFKQGHIEQAQALHERLMPMMQGLFETANPIMVKKCLELIGMPMGALRLPLIEANYKQTERCKELIAACL